MATRNGDLPTNPTARAVCATSYLVRRSGVAVYPIEEDVILFDRASEQITRLNRTAYRVWQCCDGHHSPESIAAMLSREHEVPESVAMLDVKQTLETLEAMNLVELTSEIG